MSESAKRAAKRQVRKMRQHSSGPNFRSFMQHRDSRVPYRLQSSGLADGWFLTHTCGVALR